MESNSKSAVSWIIIAIFLIICVISSVYVYRLDEKPKDKTDLLITACQKKIDAARADSAARGKKILLLTDSINSLQAQIDANNQIIEKDKIKYYVKIKHINTLSDDSLAKFFTGRFK